jgi:hypothetical protein
MTTTTTKTPSKAELRERAARAGYALSVQRTDQSPYLAGDILITEHNNLVGHVARWEDVPAALDRLGA